MGVKPDFSGWVTKANLKCTDGRTIAEGAFAHQDGAEVPLVYQHNHTDVEQVLGVMKLTKKPEGVWGDGFFNSAPKSQHAKAAVKDRSLTKMSVWAKDLDETPDYANKQMLVHDGEIQEVSLVLRGANPGAIITDVMAHSVNGVQLDPEDDLLAVTGEITHSDIAAEDAPKPEDKPADAPKPEDKPAENTGDGKTVAEELATLTPEQQAAVNQFIDDLVPDLITQALAEEPVLQHDGLNNSTKGHDMSRNMFDRTNKGNDRPQIKHDDMAKLLNAAKGPKGEGGDGAVTSLREFVRSNSANEMVHADAFGVENLEVLFPEAQALMTTPKFVDRRQEWVRVFINGAGKSPFSHVRSMHADITADEARARGYIKGNKKVDEVFPIFKRETGPAWIYKRQKLNRQDIIDVVTFDLVAWIKVEMRGKLDEELARAAMFSDGRPTMVNGDLNPDKIQEPSKDSATGNGIRSIVNDADLYVTRISVPLAADATGVAWNAMLDAGVEASEFYMGSGNKTAFVSFKVAARLLTIRDNFGHRIYRNLSEVAGDMDVSQIVRVPTELFPEDVLAIVLDLADYNFGTDRGGELTFFDDFDIDFNQYKYLYEVYLSGALVTPYAAQIYVRVDPTGVLVEDIPLPVVAENVITVPTATGVEYRRTDTNALVAGGSTITLNDTNLKTVTIEASPTDGYYFNTDADVKDSKRFTYRAPSA